MSVVDVDLTVYPDECDAFGHLNQASFLSLFERARWEVMAQGPGMNVFTRHGARPAGFGAGRGGPVSDAGSGG